MSLMNSLRNETVVDVTRVLSEGVGDVHAALFCGVGVVLAGESWHVFHLSWKGFLLQSSSSQLSHQMQSLASKNACPSASLALMRFAGS